MIRHEVAVVDGPAVGRGLLMIVSVRTRRGQQADTESFRKAMLANPAVMQFYFVTGRSDYVVIYSAASMDEYDEFIESVLAIDPNLLTDTNVVIRPLKVSLTIPISPMPSAATPARTALRKSRLAGQAVASGGSAQVHGDRRGACRQLRDLALDGAAPPEPAARERSDPKRNRDRRCGQGRPQPASAGRGSP